MPGKNPREVGNMANQTPITVFIADDHAMVREALAAMLSKDPDITVVGQCGDGLHVTKKIRALRPNVAILDITMPGLNGLDVCSEVTRKVKGTYVLILTMHDDEQFIARSIQVGASGYLLKEAAADQLTEAVKRVSRGQLYLGPGIREAVVVRITRNNGDPYDTLTVRERQVLQMIAEGLTSRKIAEALNISVKTVDTHRMHLMHKLDIHDKAELIKYAIRRGIVPLK